MRPALAGKRDGHPDAPCPSIISSRVLSQRKTNKLIMKSELINPRLAFCLGNMKVSGDNLIPITGEDYLSFVSDLRRKVEHLAQPSGYNPSENWSSVEHVVTESRSMGFADWVDVVESLENRIQEAYRVDGLVCSGCGSDGIVVIGFRSGKGSWRRFCGMAGYMLICTDCMRQLKFSVYSRS